MREQDPGDRFAAIARDLHNQTSQIATLDRIGVLARETIQRCDHAGITILDRRERITAVGATHDFVILMAIVRHILPPVDSNV